MNITREEAIAFFKKQLVDSSEGKTPNLKLGWH